MILGGWAQASEAFSTMCADPLKRNTFVTSVVPFLLEFGFEGIDLDWEFPGFRSGNSTNPEDRDNFSLLVEELSAELKANGFYLTGAFHPMEEVVEIAYDVPTIAPFFDYMTIMVYSFHGFWIGHE